MTVSLTYLERINISDSSEGLNEPSGLALASDRRALWTISDDTQKIFKLDLEGNLLRKDSFTIEINGLEGITTEDSHQYLYVVREETNEVYKLSIEDRSIVTQKRLEEMEGYLAISQYFDLKIDNKGLEGVAWNPQSETLFVLKEAQPGLLVEVSADLERILNYQVLDANNGFFAPDIDCELLDFSDLCYDVTRQCFWIVSDVGKRIFLYDSQENRVLQSNRLGYSKSGKYREIKKAEGVAIDLEAGRLYVVSDEEARLYIYNVRE